MGNAGKGRRSFQFLYYLCLISSFYLLWGCSGFINRGIFPAKSSSDLQTVTQLSESSRLNRSAIWGEKEGQFALIPEKDLYLIERDLREWVELDYFLRDFGRWAFQPEEEPTEEMELVFNKEVDRFLNYFSSDASAFFSRALSRSGKYLPVMQEIFRNNGLPEDLVYLVLIESGFHPNAVSPANAVGPWQFIKSTGKNYGLVINEWIDERRDPIKSTYAASQYLKDLYNLFGSWDLAKAGYNAGEYRVLKAIEKAKTNDFWELSKNGYLKRETREYVPKFMAAAIIAKNPEKYGFKDITYDDPLKYDEVEVKGPIDLRTVAEASGIPYEKVKELNPALKKNVIPANSPPYKLKLAYGTGAKFIANMQAVEVNKRTASVATRHSLKRGESGKSIASKYGLSEDGKRRVSYIVKPGDSLFKIAEHYGLTVKTISEINSIKDSSRIVSGQTIIIPIKDTRLAGNVDAFQKYVSQYSRDKDKLKQESVIHEVKKGDTLWNIAQVYNVDYDKIAEWNRLGSSQYIKPGDKLKIFILKD